MLSLSNVEELRQMRPSNAVFYRFNSAIATVGIEDPAESEQLGPKAAFVHLKERGCDLVTQEWVTTQYGLILWKLAGLVCLEPEREQDPKTKRWCWPEVIRQLLYRSVLAFQAYAWRANEMLADTSAS